MSISISKMFEKAFKTEDYHQRIRLCSQAVRLISSILPFKHKEHLILSDSDLPRNLIIAVSVAEAPIKTLLDALFYKFKDNDPFLKNWLKKAESLLGWNPEKEVIDSLRQLNTHESLNTIQSIVEDKNEPRKKNTFFRKKHFFSTADCNLGNQMGTNGALVSIGSFGENDNGGQESASGKGKGFKIIRNTLKQLETPSIGGNRAKYNPSLAQIDNGPEYPPTDSIVMASGSQGQKRINYNSTQSGSSINQSSQLGFMNPEVLRNISKIKKLAFESTSQVLQIFKTRLGDLTGVFSLLEFSKNALEGLYSTRNELEAAWEFFQSEAKEEIHKIRKKDKRNIERLYNRLQRKSKKTIILRGGNQQQPPKDPNQVGVTVPELNGTIEEEKEGGSYLENASESETSSIGSQEKEAMKKKQTDMLLKLQKKQEVQMRLESLLFSEETEDSPCLAPEIKQSFEANPLYPQTIIEFILKPFSTKVEETLNENSLYLGYFLHLNPLTLKYFVGNFERAEQTEESPSKMIRFTSLGGSLLDRDGKGKAENSKIYNSSFENTPKSSLMRGTSRKETVLKSRNRVIMRDSPGNTPMSQKESKNFTIMLEQNMSQENGKGSSLDPEKRLKMNVRTKNLSPSSLTPQSPNLQRIQSLQSPATPSRFASPSPLKKNMTVISNAGLFVRRAANSIQNSSLGAEEATPLNRPRTKFSKQEANNKFKIMRKPTRNMTFEGGAGSFESPENEVIFRSFRVFEFLANSENFEFFSRCIHQPLQSLLIHEFTETIADQTEEPKVIVSHLTKLFEFYVMKDPGGTTQMIISSHLLFVLLPSIGNSLVSSFILFLLSSTDSWLKLGVPEKKSLWNYLKKTEFFSLCAELLVHPHKKKMAFDKYRELKKNKEHSKAFIFGEKQEPKDQNGAQSSQNKKRKGSLDEKPEKPENPNIRFFSREILSDPSRPLNSENDPPDIDLIEMTLDAQLGPLAMKPDSQPPSHYSITSLTSLSSRFMIKLPSQDIPKCRSQLRLADKGFSLYSAGQEQNRKEDFKANALKADKELEAIRADMSQVLYPDTNKYRDHPVFSMAPVLKSQTDEFSLSLIDFIKGVAENLSHINSFIPFLPGNLGPGLLHTNVIDALFVKDGVFIESIFKCFLTSFGSSFSRNLSVSVSLACGDVAITILKYFKELSKEQLPFNSQIMGSANLINTPSKDQTPGSSHQTPESIDQTPVNFEIKKPKQRKSGVLQKNIPRSLGIMRKIAFFYFHLLQKIIINHHLNSLSKKTNPKRLGRHRLMLAEAFLAILEIDTELEVLGFVTPRCLHVLLSWCFIFNQNNILIGVVGRILSLMITKGEEYTVADAVVRLNIGSLFQRVYSIHDNLKFAPTFQLLFILIDDVVKSTFETLGPNKNEEEALEAINMARSNREEEGGTGKHRQNMKKSIFERKKERGSVALGQNKKVTIPGLIFLERLGSEENSEKKPDSKGRKLRLRMSTSSIKHHSELMGGSEGKIEKMKDLKEFLKTSKCWVFLKEKIIDSLNPNESICDQSLEIKEEPLKKRSRRTSDFSEKAYALGSSKKITKLKLEDSEKSIEIRMSDLRESSEKQTEKSMDWFENQRIKKIEKKKRESDTHGVLKPQQEGNERRPKVQIKSFKSHSKNNSQSGMSMGQFSAVLSPPSSLEKELVRKFEVKGGRDLGLKQAGSSPNISRKSIDRNKLMKERLPPLKSEPMGSANETLLKGSFGSDFHDDQNEAKSKGKVERKPNGKLEDLLIQEKTKSVSYQNSQKVTLSTSFGAKNQMKARRLNAVSPVLNS